MLSDSMLRWRCRRGKKELDVLLGLFLDRHLASLNTAQREALECLLALEDDELLDRILGRVPATDADTATVLGWLSDGA